jgi:hypothetical protein
LRKLIEAGLIVKTGGADSLRYLPGELPPSLKEEVESYTGELRRILEVGGK